MSWQPISRTIARSMLVNALLFIVGLIALTWGANLLVTRSAALAYRLNVQPIIVGTTIVALGTSLPEFVVSMTAQISGTGGIALGNVIGSNVANIGLILGAAAVIAPIAVSRKIVKVEYSLMLLTSLLLVGLAIDGSIGVVDGTILSVVFVGFLFFYVRSAKRASANEAERTMTPDDVGSFPSWTVTRMLIMIVIGLVLLAGGATLLVDSASNLAEALGVPPHVIAITMIAIGTSVPELATCIVAGLKKQNEIAVGNVLGSNIFNTCFVLGPSAMVGRLDLSQTVLRYDITSMLFFALLLLPFLLTKRRLGRVEGILLLTLYAAYIALHIPGAPANPGP